MLSAQAEETQKRVQGATSVVLQMQQEVWTLSSLARTADLTAKMASEKLEREVESLQRELTVQKIASVQEAEATKSAQDVIARKLQEAQQMIQTTTQVSQTYEAQLATLTQKMATMEQLLIEQRKKGQQLESENHQPKIGSEV